jgi:hypothetical protein
MYTEASKEEVLKKITDRASQILLQSGNCAQTSFLVRIPTQSGHHSEAKPATVPT